MPTTSTLSRAKENGLTNLRVLVFVFSLTAAAFAADLTIKVVDPLSTPVAGAQVQLLRAGSTRVLATRTTSAEGIAVFHADASRKFDIRVLAPGFAPGTVRGTSVAAEVQVKLQIAPSSETVVVSATRTPVVGEAAGADVATLNSGQLQVANPIAGSDAMRFLPGAVVNTAGQRGGLSSLFVRGGESNYNKVIVDGVTVNEPGGTFDFGTMSLAQGDRIEFVRGAQSTIYGSDAMTSVVQMWTRTGNTRLPELRFGADGGNFSTAHGDASLAGAAGRFD
jgi:outer membrane receptor protein involved in Fe transport